MNFQRRQESIRRILAAVAAKWGVPEGWRFTVEVDGKLDLFKLRVAKVTDDKRYDHLVSFTFEEMIRYDRVLVERKVLNMYQECLRAVERKD